MNRIFKNRSISLVGISSILVLAVTGLFLWRGHSLQDYVVEDVSNRKVRDAAFAARMLRYSDPQYYNTAIAASHRSTVLLVVEKSTRAIVATNERDLAKNTVPTRVQTLVLRLNGGSEDLLFTQDGIKYHAAHSAINEKYEVYIISNISKILKDNWFNTFIQLFFIWATLVSGVIFYCVIVIRPIRSLKQATKTGQPAQIFGWWPAETKALATSYNQMLQAQNEAARGLRHDIKTASGGVVQMAVKIKKTGLLDSANEVQIKSWELLTNRADLVCTLVNDIGRLWEPLKLEAQPLSNLLPPLMALYATKNIEWGEFPAAIAHYDKSAIVAKVLGNLINNAMLYAGPDPVVKVGVKTKPDGFVIYVQDNGQGIYPEDINQILTSYGASARLQPDTTVGTGTGLFSARKALQAHGWELKCKSSREEGRSGSIFYFEVPAHGQH